MSTHPRGSSHSPAIRASRRRWSAEREPFDLLVSVGGDSLRMSVHSPVEPLPEGLAVFIAAYLANETALPNINLLHLSSKKALDADPGLRIPNMLEAALDGSFKGLYVQGEDLIARVTAQTCRQSGLSVVYTELLDFDGAVGVSIGDIAAALCTVIGILAGYYGGRLDAILLAFGTQKIIYHSGTPGSLNNEDMAGVFYEWHGAPRKMAAQAASSCATTCWRAARPPAPA